jgi:hypothetical protein
VEGPGVDGKIIVKWMFQKWDGVWIYLAEDGERWRAFVNVIINRRVA